MKDQPSIKAIAEYINSLSDNDDTYLFNASTFSNTPESIFKAYIADKNTNITIEDGDLLRLVHSFNPDNLETFGDYSGLVDKLNTLDIRRFVDDFIVTDDIMEKLNASSLDKNTIKSSIDIITNQKYTLAASVALASSYYTQHSKASEILINAFNDNKFSLGFGRGFGSILDNTKILDQFLASTPSLTPKSNKDRETSTKEMFEKIHNEPDFLSNLGNSGLFVSTTNILEQAKNKSPLILTEEAYAYFHHFPGAFMKKVQNPDFIIFEDTNDGGDGGTSGMPPLSPSLTSYSNYDEQRNIDSIDLFFDKLGIPGLEIVNLIDPDPSKPVPGPDLPDLPDLPGFPAPSPPNHLI